MSSKTGERPRRSTRTQKTAESSTRPPKAIHTRTQGRAPINKETKISFPLPPSSTSTSKGEVKAPKARIKILAYRSKDEYVAEAKKRVEKVKDERSKRRIQDFIDVAEDPGVTLQRLKEILINDAHSETVRRKKSRDLKKSRVLKKSKDAEKNLKVQTVEEAKTEVAFPSAGSSAESDKTSVRKKKQTAPMNPDGNKSLYLVNVVGDAASLSNKARAQGLSKSKGVLYPPTYDVGPERKSESNSRETTPRKSPTPADDMHMKSSPGDQSRSTSRVRTITKSPTPSPSRRGASQMSSPPKETIVKRRSEKDGTRTEVSSPSTPKSENEKNGIQLSPKTQRLSSPLREDRGSITKSDHSERETQSPQGDEYGNLFEHDLLTASLADYYNDNGPYDSYMI